MELIVLPLSYIPVPIFERLRSLHFAALIPLPLVLVTICIDHLAVPLELSCDPVASVRIPIDPLPGA